MMYYLLYHHKNRIGSIVSHWDAVRHNLNRGFEIIAESDNKKALWHVAKIIHKY